MTDTILQPTCLTEETNLELVEEHLKSNDLKNQRLLAMSNKTDVNAFKSFRIG